MSRGRQNRPTSWAVLGVPLLLFLAIPLIALVCTGGVPSALAELQGADAADAIWLSLRTTMVTALIIALTGTPLAYWIGSSHGFWRRVVEGVAELPVVLPPAAAGVALLIAFGRNGFLNLGVSFTWIAVVLAQLFVSTPFFLRASIGAFSSQPEDLADAARVDGATSTGLFLSIALPIALPELIGGLAVAWARAAGEFGATIIFAGNFPGRTQTMPLAIYLGFEVNLRQALALSFILMLVAVIGFGVAQYTISRFAAPHSRPLA